MMSEYDLKIGKKLEQILEIGRFVFVMAKLLWFFCQFFRKYIVSIFFVIKGLYKILNHEL